MDNWCIICKEFVGKPRYEVEVKDNYIDTSIKSHLCRFCYNKFIDSFHHKGFFKLAKMINWMKGKYPMRRI